MSSKFPLTAEELRLRTDLGEHGDIGNELHAKVDRLKFDTQEILTDTANMQPKLGAPATGTISGDIAQIKSVVDSTSSSSAAIIAHLTDSGYGLPALDGQIESLQSEVAGVVSILGTPVVSVSNDIAQVKAVSDSILEDTQEIITVIGSPVNGSVIADIADLASKVGQIQNNTRTTVAILSEFELPPVGQTYYYLVQLNNFDTAGNMEDPDTAPVVAVTSFNGADRSNNLVNDAFNPTTTMIKDTEGRYHIKYRVTDSHPVNEGLLFTITIVEAGVNRLIDRVTRVVEEVSSTFTANDRLVLNDVLADTADMQPKLGTPANSTISADIAQIKVVADSTKVDTQNIEADTQDIQANIDLIKNKNASSTYDRGTDSLEAIRDYLEIHLTSAKNPKFLKANKVSGAIASGASEMVILEGLNGISSPFFNMKELRVVPSTQTSSNFTVEVFEDAAGTIGLLQYEKAKANKGDLRLSLDLVYINQDASPSNKVYVKITNVADSSSSVFNVEVRGMVLQQN